MFNSDTEGEWLTSYRFIYYCNTVLEGLQKIKRNVQNQAVWDKLKGEALFFRAKCHLNVANIWAEAYDENSAATDLGIPLRLTTDFNEQSVRASMRDTYNQIVSDLTEAVNLLPVEPSHVVRPSLPAAYGLLARVYLFMRDYPKCLENASACLALKNDLLDYNDVSGENDYSFDIFNDEVLYHSYISTSGLFGKVNESLFDMYEPDDLRKSLFFNDENGGTYPFTGSYYGRGTFFSGIAVDEVYLMRAECLARNGDVDNAISDLNTLLEKRYRFGSFEPYRITDKTKLLDIILDERRKELVFRGIRWPDVKRLNREGENISMTRTNFGRQEVLLPNDPKFLLPIPERIIELTGMPQNPR